MLYDSNPLLISAGMPSKPVTESTLGIVMGFLTSSTTNYEKEIVSDPVKIRRPTTLFSFASTNPTDSGVIQMSRSNTPFLLSVIGWIMVLTS